MRCPSCGQESKIDDALYCARCGAPLAAAEGAAVEGAATTRLDRDVIEDGTTRLEVPPGSQAEPSREQPPADPPTTADTAERPGLPGPPAAREFVGSLRASLAGAGWPEAIGAACLAFLAVLCVGVVLVVAIKLQQPGFGSGASPVAILTTIVMLALGSLGADLGVGELQIAAMPLGALLAAGAAIAWVTSSLVARRDALTPERRALEGAKIGIPFGVLCLVAALVFRFRSGPDLIAIEPGSALVMGLLWGCLFGALGGLRSQGKLRLFARAGLMTLHARSQTAYAGFIGAASGLVMAAVLAAGAGLIWVIAGLATGAPGGDFGLGDALAAVIYIAAFLPNIVVSIVAVALGAPIEIGARITVGATAMGPLKRFSLLDWPGNGPPWYVYVVVLIAIAATVFLGYATRRAAGVKPRPVESLAVAVGLFAVVLGALALLAEARLGAGLVTARGFGRVAPDAWFTFLFAALWAVAGGAAGWRLAESSITPGIAVPGEQAPEPVAEEGGDA